MLKLSVLFLATFVLSQTFATQFPFGVFKTESSSTYEYFNTSSLHDLTPYEGSFKFQVKASSNVSISFSTGGYRSDIEFEIGTSENMKSRILVNGKAVVKLITPMILNETSFQLFEIKWNWNREFYFAHYSSIDNQTQNIMLYKNESLVPVHFIGIKTEFSAEWIVRERATPKMFESVIKTDNSTDLNAGDRLRCVVVESKNKTEPVRVVTGHYEDYKNVSVYNPSQLNISILAKDYVYILLSTSNGSYPNIELLLRSESMRASYNDIEIKYLDMKYVLNEYVYRKFLIEIDHYNGVLSVSRYGQEESFSINIRTFPIYVVGVKTHGVYGDFIIHEAASNKIGDARATCYVDED